MIIGVFFFRMQGYSPEGSHDTLVSISVVGGIVAVYLLIEYLDTQLGATLTPLETATETFLSYLPLGMFWSVATAWLYGNITISGFQLVAGGLFLLVTLLDVLGFSASLFQRLYLTDEAKLTK